MHIRIAGPCWLGSLYERGTLEWIRGADRWENKELLVTWPPAKCEPNKIKLYRYNHYPAHDVMRCVSVVTSHIYSH